MNEVADLRDRVAWTRKRLSGPERAPNCTPTTTSNCQMPTRRAIATSLGHEARTTRRNLLRPIAGRPRAQLRCDLVG